MTQPWAEGGSTGTRNLPRPSSSSSNLAGIFEYEDEDEDDDDQPPLDAIARPESC
jgi:hypothetical protein